MALEPCQLPIACVRLCGVRLLYVLRVTWAGLYAQTSSYATQAHESGSDSDTSSSSSSSDDEREGRGMGVSDFDRRRDGMDAPREHFVIEMTEEKLPDVISVLEDLQPPPVSVCALGWAVRLLTTLPCQGITFCTTQRPAGSSGVAGNIQFVTAMQRVNWANRKDVTTWNRKCVCSVQCAVNSCAVQPLAKPMIHSHVSTAGSRP